MNKQRRKPTAAPVQPAFSEQTVVVLRKQVRLVLSALPATRRKASKPVLRAGLETLGFTFNDAELDAAVEWNHARNYVDFETNDYETDEWFLTEKGAKA